jgi:hypothetical protein
MIADRMQARRGLARAVRDRLPPLADFTVYPMSARTSPRAPLKSISDLSLIDPELSYVAEAPAANGTSQRACCRRPL